MIALIRIALLMLIIYLIQRAFSAKSPSDGAGEADSRIKGASGETRAKKSKELGEYVDYEVIDKKD